LKYTRLFIEGGILDILTSTEDADLKQLVSNYSTWYYVTERYGERWNNGKL